MWHIWGRREIYTETLVVKSEGKRPLRRCRHRWDSDVNMDRKGVVWKSIDWVSLAQDGSK
jgi:hypothetical protein